MLRIKLRMAGLAAGCHGLPHELSHLPLFSCLHHIREMVCVHACVCAWVYVCVYMHACTCAQAFQSQSLSQYRLEKLEVIFPKMIVKILYVLAPCLDGELEVFLIADHLLSILEEGMLHKNAPMD